jgi:hypothetical protein
MGCGLGAVLTAVAKRLPEGRVTGVDLWCKIDQSGNAATKLYVQRLTELGLLDVTRRSLGPAWTPSIGMLHAFAEWRISGRNNAVAALPSEQRSLLLSLTAPSLAGGDELSEEVDHGSCQVGGLGDGELDLLQVFLHHCSAEEAVEAHDLAGSEREG